MSRRTWRMPGVLARYYDDPQMLVRVEKAFQDLTIMAREVNAECGEARVRVHTYRAVSTFGATIAEPGTSDANGFVEFHVTGRPPRRIRFGRDQAEAVVLPDGRQPQQRFLA